MKKTIYISLFTALILGLASCKKADEFLPPNWNYAIPDTRPIQGTVLGAYYVNRVDTQWAYDNSGKQMTVDLPTLNRDSDGNPRGYTYNTEGVMKQHCLWADQAGLDFFIFQWNNSATDNALITTFAQNRAEEGNVNVRIAISLNYTHLSLNDKEGSAATDKKLIDSGVSFDNIVQEFKNLYTTLFSQPYYYRLADGRPVIIIPGAVGVNYDYQRFIPAFRQAMKSHVEYLRETDPTIAENALDFYFIGEIAGNWLPPQRNEEASKSLDGNLMKQWYPSRYYERWAFFNSYTDMAWQNWREYANKWGNDFIPNIFPEYAITASGSRSVERSIEHYKSFCNVAKRNIGKNKIIIINSWNEFESSSALEPADRYGEQYLDLTRQNFKH